LRALSFMPQVKLLVEEMMRSLLSAFWSFVLLFVLLLFFSLVFMQATADCILEGDLSTSAGVELLTHFSSMFRALLALFSMVTGGLEWAPVYRALSWVSGLYGSCFILYVFFVMVAFLNVVAATFVDSALATTKAHASEDAAKAEEEFGRLIRDFECEREGGMVQLEDLQDLLEVPQVKGYLASLGLDSSDARGIFDLLDTSGRRQVETAELTCGCARFASAVRGADFVPVLLATRILSAQLQALSGLGEVRVSTL